MAVFELVIGILFIVLGWQFFNISNLFSTMLHEMGESPYTPNYIYDLYKTNQTGFLAGGFIAFVHGVKRTVDNTLNAWVKSALPTEEEQ
jgi:uncharacterized membrane protein YphA (DoxX/SURF4 family)